MRRCPDCAASTARTCPCIDDPAPRLSWALESASATSARPRTGSASTGCGTAAGSSRRDSVDVAYAGRRCRRASEFEWTVQVWDEAGAASEWSEPARFRTGPASWTAQWIGRDRIHDPADGRARQRRRARRDRLLMRRLLACPYLRRDVHGRRRACAGRRSTRPRAAWSSSSSTARASATRCSRRAGRTTAKRIEYAAHDVTALRARRRERARRDPRRRVVRRLRRLRRRCRPRQPLRPRARAAVRAAPRARGRHASRSSPPTRRGGRRPGRSSTRTC